MLHVVQYGTENSTRDTDGISAALSVNQTDGAIGQSNVDITGWQTKVCVSKTKSCCKWTASAEFGTTSTCNKRVGGVGGLYERVLWKERNTVPCQPGLSCCQQHHPGCRSYFVRGEARGISVHHNY